MTADGATTDFGEAERLRRAIDRTPRRPTIIQPVILSLPEAPARLIALIVDFDGRRRTAKDLRMRVFPAFTS